MAYTLFWDDVLSDELLQDGFFYNLFLQKRKMLLPACSMDLLMVTVNCQISSLEDLNKYYLAKAPSLSFKVNQSLTTYTSNVLLAEADSFLPHTVHKKSWK